MLAAVDELREVLDAVEAFFRRNEVTIVVVLGTSCDPLLEVDVALLCVLSRCQELKIRNGITTVHTPLGFLHREIVVLDKSLDIEETLREDMVSLVGDVLFHRFGVVEQREQEEGLLRAVGRLVEKRLDDVRTEPDDFSTTTHLVMDIFERECPIRFLNRATGVLEHLVRSRVERPVEEGRGKSIVDPPSRLAAFF